MDAINAGRLRGALRSRSVGHRCRVGPPGGQLIDARVGNAATSTCRADNCGSTGNRPSSGRVEVGQRHQRRLRVRRKMVGNHCMPFDKRRSQRHGIDQLAQLATRGANTPARLLIRSWGQEVDMVAGP